MIRFDLHDGREVSITSTARLGSETFQGLVISRWSGERVVRYERKAWRYEYAPDIHAEVIRLVQNACPHEQLVFSPLFDVVAAEWGQLSVSDSEYSSSFVNQQLAILGIRLDAPLHVAKAAFVSLVRADLEAGAPTQDDIFLSPSGFFENDNYFNGFKYSHLVGAFRVWRHIRSDLPQHPEGSTVEIREMANLAMAAKAQQ